MADTDRSVRMELFESLSRPLEGVPASGTAGAVTYGAGTQFTVGGAGGASALPATPLGYLRIWVGTTEVAIPYYNRV